MRGKSKRIILNKIDLPERLDASTLRSLFPDEEALRISAKDGTGVDELCEAIYQFVMGDISLQETLVITRERHRQCLVAET